MDDRDTVAFRRALGKRIRVLRVVRELTQDELAQWAGVTRNLVSAFERATQRLDVVALIRLAAALDVPVPELLAGIMPQQARADVPTGTVRSFGWDSEV
jgi:transcriptional regulator with XRE-family HTH domain